VLFVQTVAIQGCSCGDVTSQDVYLLLVSTDC